MCHPTIIDCVITIKIQSLSCPDQRIRLGIQNVFYDDGVAELEFVENVCFVSYSQVWPDENWNYHQVLWIAHCAKLGPTQTAQVCETWLFLRAFDLHLKIESTEQALACARNVEWEPTTAQQVLYMTNQIQTTGALSVTPRLHTSRTLAQTSGLPQFYRNYGVVLLCFFVLIKYWSSSRVLQVPAPASHARLGHTTARQVSVNILTLAVWIFWPVLLSGNTTCSLCRAGTYSSGIGLHFSKSPMSWVTEGAAVVLGPGHHRSSRTRRSCKFSILIRHDHCSIMSPRRDENIVINNEAGDSKLGRALEGPQVEWTPQLAAVQKHYFAS